MAGHIAAITRALGAVHWLAVELGQQDMRDGMQHGFGSAFEQIGDADEKLSLAQADGVVDRDERVKPNVHRRNGRVRAQSAVGFAEDFCEIRGHVRGKSSMRIGQESPSISLPPIGALSTLGSKSEPWRHQIKQALFRRAKEQSPTNLRPVSSESRQDDLAAS